MKIVKIFGFVVAVHAAVFVLIFAIPGCRTSARKGAAAPGAAEVSYAGAPAPAPAGDFAPAPRPAGINATDTSVAYNQGPATIRYSPTRPGAATTPAPAAAAPAPATYTVVKGDNLWSVAKKNGITVAELAAANNLAGNGALQIGQKLVIPGAAPAAASAGAPAASAAASAERPTYTVQAGDTLGAIARRNGTTVAALRSANNLRNDIVRPGQVLTLPAGSTATASEASAPAAAAAAPAPAAARAPSGTMTHTVAPGETLGAIAKQYGVRAGDIAVANNIDDPRKLRAGQTLNIPGWQAPGGAAKAAPAPSTPAATPAPATPAPAATDTGTPTILIIPGAEQALPATPPESNIPVIRVEEPAADGAPRIE